MRFAAEKKSLTLSESVEHWYFYVSLPLHVKVVVWGAAYAPADRQPVGVYFTPTDRQPS
jgi:hypothetical protein